VRVLLVIPARLHSTRLPRKMLLKETGKYLIEHVHERARLVRGADRVVIATDDESIRAVAEGFGAESMMTSPDHPSGSDRAAEVARRTDADLVVNLQGDEPEVDPHDVDALIRAMVPGDLMGTLVFDGLDGAQQHDVSVVKAVVEDGFAVDFRREPTPGARRHLGIYAYDAAFLQRFSRLAPSAREKERRLEQMRALDHGVAIRAVDARHASAGIDEADDYAAFVTRWRAAN
jgi:3-deoxy-manno-octulosonate cytidylyltransferase (CMP-KDO synthetase)